MKSMCFKRRIFVIQQESITISWVDATQDCDKQQGHSAEPSHKITAPLIVPQPPKYAEYLLHFLLSDKMRKGLLGDWAEEYVELAKTHGAKEADVWYWSRVVCSLWPLILRLGYRLIGIHLIHYLNFIFHLLRP